MLAIKAYRLETRSGIQALALPAAAQPIAVGMLGGALMLWALVETTNESDLRQFMVIETDHRCPAGAWAHVGTVVFDGVIGLGATAWHIFAREEIKQ